MTTKTKERIIRYKKAFPKDKRTDDEILQELDDWRADKKIIDNYFKKAESNK